jgi:XTP/dITP diphosphohydrolase
MLAHVRVRVVSAEEVGAPDVDEDQDTFEGNARKKALEGAAFSGLVTLADDSGLEVDALGGAPGVHSARYSGGSAEANVEKLLGALASTPEPARTARFRCVLALVDPSTPEAPILARGVLEGSIARARRGRNGFGYDPVFLPLGYGATLAELEDREKDSLSHRARALEAMREHIEARFGR